LKYMPKWALIINRVNNAANLMAKRIIGNLKKLIDKRWIGEFLRHYIGGLYNRSGKHHIFLMAGGLAFTLFVCIMPLILIIFSLLGVILEKPSVAGEIESFIDRAVPYENYASFVKEKVFMLVNEFKVFKSLAGVIGLIGLFVASTGLFSGMRTILNMIYKVERDESVLMGKLRDLLSVILVALYFLLSIAILPLLEAAKILIENVLFIGEIEFGFLSDLALAGISFLLILLTFIIIYWLIPYRKLHLKVILMSALAASVFWESARQLFGFYLANIITLKMVYGAYIFIVVIAFWIYYTSIVFILGAELGQLFRERLEKL
jgi:membrane protein